MEKGATKAALKMQSQNFEGYEMLKMEYHVKNFMAPRIRIPLESQRTD